MIIASMTSYPVRLDLVPYAYTHFITKQTLKCDKYVLWLSRAEFNGEKNPSELGLQDLVNLGLEIHWCDEDSKIHIRHNSIKLWHGAYNLIIDEDLYYPETYTEELIDAANKYPNCIISYFSSFEIFTGYFKYYLPRFKKPSIRNKFNGGLVCFPPNTFPMSSFIYEKTRDIICPFHDETWINLFAKYEGRKVFGLHKMDWDSIEHIHIRDNIEHLHDKHSNTAAKYSFDVVQFNRVLCVFPQLKKIYKRNIFDLYFFCDLKEIKSYQEKYKDLIVSKIGE